MKILASWLREMCDPGLAPEQVAALLTGAGLEVEAVRRLGEGLAGVVVAEIREKRPHPGADRLSVCRVWDGTRELQIVCGAPNAATGLKVPLAHAGAVLPGGRAIGKAAVRGIESHGMLCSAKELGLSEDSEGLFVLAEDAAPGTPIAQHLGLDDTVLELNLTPNRADALSHLGVARELSALTGAPLRPPYKSPLIEEATAAPPARVLIEAPDRCARYASYVVEGVQVGPSPAWLRRRLEACGIRSISNLVDATNYVLLALGHPLHAFDLDKLADATIVVRQARPGETLVTLDGKERGLSPDDLVIADARKAQALAGVMGGGHSEVSQGTTRLLLESAWFDPRGVRRTARRHGLHTEASHRFERGADFECVPRALDLLAALIVELGGGRVAGGLIDVVARPRARARVRLRWARVGELLGVEVPRAETEKWLGRLGLVPVENGAEGATWEVPTARVDLTQDVDLVEEVARLRGYESIPAVIPRVAAEPEPNRERAFDAAARAALLAAGLHEAITYSFIDPADQKAVDAEVTPLALQNPLASDQAVLRTSLLPGLLRAVDRNLRNGVADVRLFELGRVFHPGEPRERARLAAVITGRRAPLGPHTGEAPVDFFDIKGVAEELCQALRVDARFGPAEDRLLHNACAVLHGDSVLGRLGELHPRVAARFGLARGVFLLEMEMSALYAAAGGAPTFRGLPRFPAVHRDVAVVVDEADSAARLEAAIRVIAAPLAEDVVLFDVYRGAQIPPGKKSLAFRIRYRAPDRTLTDEEASAAHTRIVEEIRRRFGGVLRA